MRPTVLVLALTLAPLQGATAQTRPTIPPGMTVRVWYDCPETVASAGGSDRGCQQVQGDFEAVSGDSIVLVVGRPGSTLTLPVAAVTQLRVRRGSNSGRGAATGALIGGAVLGVTSGWDQGSITFGAGVGALLGTGSRARKKAGIGFLIGAGTLALAGYASGDDPPCSGWFCSFTAEEKAIFGAVAGGFTGGVIGGIIGVVTQTEHWEEVPLQRLRVSFVPERDGRFAVAASIRF